MPRQYRTLEAMRGELRAALGFGASGAAAGANQTIIDAFLRDAQTILYNAHDWAHLRRWELKALGASQYLVDYPTAANPDRITAISVLRGNVWSPALDKGIAPEMYTYQDNPSWPQRWEPYEQIQLWPISDQAYSLRIFYGAALGRFTENGDRASIDDTNIMLIAKWAAKAHYRQPDAGIYEKQGEALLMRLKAKSWGKTKFNPNDYSEQLPMAKPVVV